MRSDVGAARAGAGFGSDTQRRFARDPDGRVARERIRTPSGRLIIRTHRVCD
jgi:hypothetical protein